MQHPQQVQPNHKFYILKDKMTYDAHILCSFQKAFVCGEESYISYSNTIPHHAMFEVLTPMIMKISLMECDAV
jgi:hypothetical protein